MNSRKSQYVPPLPPGSKIAAGELIGGAQLSWVTKRQARVADRLASGFLIFIALIAIVSLAFSVFIFVFNPAARSIATVVQIVLIASVLFVCLRLIKRIHQTKTKEFLRLTTRDFIYEKSRGSNFDGVSLAVLNPFSIELGAVRNARGSKTVFRAPRKKVVAEIHLINGKEQLWVEAKHDEVASHDSAVQVGDSLDKSDLQWLCDLINNVI